MNLVTWIQELKKQNSVSTALDFFIENCSFPILYLEYEQTKSWLQLKNSRHLSIDSKEFCFRLHESDFGFDPAQLYDLKSIKHVDSRLRELFGSSEYQCFPMVFNNKIQGIFVGSSPSEEDLSKFFILNNYLKDFLWQKKWKKENPIDESNSCLNQNYFLRRLFIEVSRARRLQLPVSLILLQIDQYSKLKSLYGSYKLNVFVQALVRNFTGNSRAYDIFGSMEEEGQLGLILPHTSERGAGIKAEQIRWSIEGADFSKVFPAMGRLTLSIGLGEYPSVGRSADALFESCLKSLSFVQKEGGGNLTAVATPAAGFKPDFSYSPESNLSLKELT